MKVTLNPVSIIPNKRVEEVRDLCKLYNSFIGYGMDYVDSICSTPTKKGDCFYIIMKFLDDDTNRDHGQPWCKGDDEPETLQLVEYSDGYQLEAWYF